MMQLTLWMALFLVPAAMQTPDAAPSVENLLPQLFAYGRQYQARLPSLTCDESITSQEVRKGKVRKEVRIESTLREIRTEREKDPFVEHHEFKTVDGHAPPAHFNIPFLVQGGFANALGFTKNQQAPCFDFILAVQDGGRKLKLDLTLRADRATPLCDDIPDGYRKSILIDRASGRVDYLERTVSAEAAKRLKDVYFASMEYGPQTFGDETLWLPVKMTAHDPKDEGRMIAVYSNCHRYTVKATLLPADGSPVK